MIDSRAGLVGKTPAHFAAGRGYSGEPVGEPRLVANGEK